MQKNVTNLQKFAKKNSNKVQKCNKNMQKYTKIVKNIECKNQKSSRAVKKKKGMACGAPGPFCISAYIFQMLLIAIWCHISDS